jgi:hypothetical protein
MNSKKQHLMKQIIFFILGLVLSQNIWAQNTPKVMAKNPIWTTEYLESEHNKSFSAPQAASTTSRPKTTSFIMEEESRESLLLRIAELESTIEKHQNHEQLVEKLNTRLISLRAELNQLDESLLHSEKDH